MSEISKEDMHMIRERLDAVRDMFRHGQLMMDNVAEYAALNDVPALLAHIDTIEPELDKLRALRQRVDEAEIALLSDNNQLVPAKVLQAWFEYIWQGVTPPTEDAD